MWANNLDNTVHHSVAVNRTRSSLLCWSLLLLYALLWYAVFFCAMHLHSPLPCSSVVLHQVIETVMPVLDFLWTLLGVSVSLRTDVMSVLCHHWPTQQLALPPSVTRHHSSSLLSSTSHLSLTLVGVCFSLARSYFYLIPFFQLLWESQCRPACSSWFSTNVVLPAPSCISPLSFSLSHPSLPRLHSRWLARHIKWPLTAASQTRSNSDITPLYMSPHMLSK